MGAREKLNEAYLAATAAAALAAGVLFASLDVALMLGVALVAALLAGGGVRPSPARSPASTRRPSGRHPSGTRRRRR